MTPPTTSPSTRRSSPGSRRRGDVPARVVARPCRLDARDRAARRAVAGEADSPRGRCTPRPARCSTRYDEVDLAHVRREQNVDADALVNAALDACGPDPVLLLVRRTVGLPRRDDLPQHRDRLSARRRRVRCSRSSSTSRSGIARTATRCCSRSCCSRVVMLGTIGRPRLLRRRLLCLPIGVFCGLVLSGAFTNDELFWWPFLGTSFPHDALLPGLVGRADRGARRPRRVLGARRPVRPLPAGAAARVPADRPVEDAGLRRYSARDRDADARRLRRTRVRAVARRRRSGLRRGRRRPACRARRAARDRPRADGPSW